MKKYALILALSVSMIASQVHADTKNGGSTNTYQKEKIQFYEEHEDVITESFTPEQKLRLIAQWMGYSPAWLRYNEQEISNNTYQKQKIQFYEEHEDVITESFTSQQKLRLMTQWMGYSPAWLRYEAGK